MTEQTASKGRLHGAPWPLWERTQNKEWVRCDGCKMPMPNQVKDSAQEASEPDEPRLRCPPQLASGTRSKQSFVGRNVKHLAPVIKPSTDYSLSPASFPHLCF